MIPGAERTWDEPPGRPHRWASRESFLASERAAVDREFSNLVEDEGDARERYLELASLFYGPDPGPTSHFPLATLAFRYDPERPLSATALERAAASAVQSASNAWHTAYHALVERNPRLELSHRLKAIGRSFGTWWPFGLEAAIEQWVADGCADGPPFEDPAGLATARLRDRLRWLRQRIGGWVYFDPPTRRLLYASEEEWRSLRDRVTAAGAPILEMTIQRKKREAEDKREKQRLLEVEAAVRGDADLWAALLKWERTVGAERPYPERPPKAAADVRAHLARFMNPGRPRGLLTVEDVRALFAEEKREERDAALAAAIPSSFAPLLDRVLRPDGDLSRWRAFQLLRSLARWELGLNRPRRLPRTRQPPQA